MMCELSSETHSSRSYFNKEYNDIILWQSHSRAVFVETQGLVQGIDSFQFSFLLFIFVVGCYSIRFYLICVKLRLFINFFVEIGEIFMICLLQTAMLGPSIVF